jgi:hypothetical protein
MLAEHYGERIRCFTPPPSLMFVGKAGSLTYGRGSAVNRMLMAAPIPVKS